VRQPTPRSLIVDLLSTLRRGSMPVAALVQAADLFGIAEGSLRVALHRLQVEGRVESDERGRYRFGAAAAPVQSVVAGWRDLDRRTRSWNGRWIAVHADTARRRRAKIDPAARALRLFGFEALAPRLCVRPSNLREGVEGVRAGLRALGLPESALICELAELDPAADTRARALWDGDALVRNYRAARREIDRSSARLADLPEREAMVESFRLGGRVLQQLVLDPLLPAPLVDEGERRALVESMRAYDQLGRDAWAGFLGRFAVPHRTAPADTRWAAEGFARTA
jgi:phenylacetic acid degradation operon negative regulatory protein